MTMNPLRRAARITLIYLLFGTAWILGSDAYLEYLHLDAEGLSRLQTYKGSIFVLTTGMIFFFLAYRELRRQYQADKEASRRQTALQSLYTATFEHAAVGMAHCSRDGRFLRVNKACCEMLGYSREALLGISLQDLSSPDDRDKDREWLHKMASGNPRSFKLDQQFLRKDGAMMWAAVTASHVPSLPSNGGDYYLLVIEDISERRASEEKLRLTQRVFDSTREGVLITDSDSRIVSVNPAFIEITGYTEEEIIGQTPKILQSGTHDRPFYQAMWQSIEQSGHWQGEVWNRRKSGEIYPEWLTISAVRDARGVITNYVGVFSDITRIKRSEAEVQWLAHYDALTGLPNRVLLMTRLEHALDICKRRGHRVVLLCCGLDRFKNINESLGYKAGDELLQAVARRIQGQLQNGDTIARFGGDEFIVLLETSRQQQDVAHLSESILDLGREPVALSNDQTVFIDISIGISMFPEDGEDAVNLLTQANTAMQQAKSEGRRTYRFYKQELTDTARARLQMESRLRNAVERSELQLFYQPIIDIRGGRIIGAEALLRWVDSELGMIMPDRFIPLAEDTGLILPLGRWVLETACRQAAAWAGAGHQGLKMAINLSSRQFEDGGLREQVAAILDATGALPASLEFEITESVLMQQDARSMETLKALRQSGIGVSLDDFGTGYSSLAYVKRFAISKLKIDRMFIKDLPGDQEDAEIVSAIIAMARSLKLRVVAEGVETREQLEFLEGLGCDELQGYLVSPPVPAAEFMALYRLAHSHPIGTSH